MKFKGIEFRDPLAPPIKSDLLPEPYYHVNIEYQDGKVRVFVDGKLFSDWESVAQASD